MIKFLLNLMMFLIMIAIGVVAFINMKGKAKEVVHEDTGMESKPVKVMTIRKEPFSASVVAYGNVQPTVVFKGKAEVKGKVTYVHPELKQGGKIAAGTVVLRIDPVDYKLSLDKNRSDFAASKTQLEQLNQEKISKLKALKLAGANLHLGAQELKRIQSIWDKGLISRSKLDAEEQKVLQLRQKVSDVQGQLNTFSSRIKNAKAKIKRARQQVEGGQTVLKRTQIEMPFDARITVANIEKNEIINANNVLFEAINTDAIQINAELPLNDMQTLLAASKQSKPDVKNKQQQLSRLQLKAEIKRIGDHEQAVWIGRVIRFSESVDPTRHTTSVTVIVDYLNKKSQSTGRPVLLKGMYVSVKLYAPAYNAIVIPRKAIHSGRAFVVNKHKKLEIRALKIRLQQGNIAEISAGLQRGDQLIVNDLIPVIEGMPLTPLPIKTTKLSSTPFLQGIKE